MTIRKVYSIKKNHFFASCLFTCFINYRKYILQITQPSQYRYTQLKYKFSVISEAPSI